MKTRHKLNEFFAGAAAGVLLLSGAAAVAQENRPLSPNELEFFEAKIRPALIEYCYDCHSAEGKVKGGLQVDGKVALLKGGSTGPAVVPGAPSKSLMVKAIQFDDENLQMPPDEKMPDNVIADLVQWVRMGAPDPRVGKQAGVLKSEEDRKKAMEHWGFKVVEKPEVPDIGNLKFWAKNEIDHFVAAKLKEKGMIPSIQADKHTLIRRAYFGLIGIPPSMEQVQDFIADESPSAYEKVIDDLLSSDHYGERWGRYWLDIARYADTRGVQNNNRGMRNRMVHAWNYRDWVVNSLNKDMPYDKFLQMQIAADLLPTARKEDLPALSYLTIHRDVANTQERIDDQIDVVTRGMMSLSVYCARCHDHKFDPVTAKDYYALYGVFNSISVPQNLPLIEEPTENPMYNDYLTEKSELVRELNEFRVDKLNEFISEVRTNTVRYMVVSYMMDQGAGISLGSRADQDKFEDDYELEADVARNWNRFLKSRTRRDDPVFTPWREFTKLTLTNWNAEAKRLSKKYYSDGKVMKGLNPLVARSFTSTPRNLSDVAARYYRLFMKADATWGQAVAKNYRDRARNPEKNIPEIKKLEDKDMEQLRQVFYGRGAPANMTYDRLKRRDNRRIENQERRWHDDMELLEMNHPGAPRRAMVVEDQGRARDSKIFIKGDPRKQGDEVIRRRFIEVLDPNGRPFSRGSGRLELAYKITSTKNPLTARVAVNRMWANHYGAPIVRTPTDFGVRAADPTHPELLDYLAARFMERGWKLKDMHKYMMMSATYQQSSDLKPKYMVSDSDNSLLWKANRRRLDFEGFRDSLLSVSGMLDTSVGGSPYNILETPFVPRRTMYAYIDRRNLPDVFRTFDFANPNMTQGERFSSTVPQQALFMMNSPFVAEMARNMVDRADIKNKIDENQKIKSFYNTAFQRDPTALEVKLGMRFLKQQDEIEKKRAPKKIWTYGFGAYDSSAKRLLRFTELPYYSILDGTWQGGEEYPDSRLGGARIGADGGSPGPSRNISVIRRWRSPIAGLVSIDGTLEHLGEVGDGMLGYIVFRGNIQLAGYGVFNQDRQTRIPKLRVRPGDTIDFVVNCRGNSNGDIFYWAPRITIAKDDQELTGTFGGAAAPNGGGAPMAAMGGGMARGGGGTVQKKGWNAEEDFYIEQEAAELRMLNAWEKYAQVVLLSNEMMFYD